MNKILKLSLIILILFLGCQKQKVSISESIKEIIAQKEEGGDKLGIYVIFVDSNGKEIIITGKMHIEIIENQIYKSGHGRIRVNNIKVYQCIVDVEEIDFSKNKLPENLKDYASSIYSFKKLTKENFFSKRLPCGLTTIYVELIRKDGIVISNEVQVQF